MIRKLVKLTIPAIFAALLLTGGPAHAADCSEWSTKSFFKTTTVENVESCLNAGA